MTCTVFQTQVRASWMHLPLSSEYNDPFTFLRCISNFRAFAACPFEPRHIDSARECEIIKKQKVVSAMPSPPTNWWLQGRTSLVCNWRGHVFYLLAWERGRGEAGWGVEWAWFLELQSPGGQICLTAPCGCWCR